MVEQQTQQFPPKKIATFAFLGGMVVIGVIWFSSTMVSNQLGYRSMTNSDDLSDNGSLGAPSFSGGSVKVGSPVLNEVVGNMTQDRKVTSNYLSVHVKEVKKFNIDMIAFVESVSGKVMSEYMTVSSDDQSESGTLSVLVPNKEAQVFFDLVGSNAIKVVDRQVNSYEISQEYTDIGRQLAQYEVTYEKILKYYDKATTVTDLLQVQSQLDQVQRNIDSLKGRKMALDELSNNTQYTIYSSTNEFNLPYVPQGTFEFAKTFKLAVRSLVMTTDKIVSGAIYLLVYVPIFAFAGLIVWAARKYLVKK